MHRRTLSSEKEFTLFNRWFPWLVPSFVVANVALFVITLYVDNCPKNSLSCFVGFSERLSFQHLKENPLHGPSSATSPNMLGIVSGLWHVRIGLLYIISGVGGNLLSALFRQSSISVGVSGALFGFLGGMLCELIIIGQYMPTRFSAALVMVLPGVDGNGYCSC